MGTLRTQVKLPKQISLIDWDVTEDGIDINGTYNYISFPSPITSFPLEGNDIPPAFISEIVISNGSFTAANGTYTRSNSTDAFTKTSGTPGAIFFGGDAWYIFSTSIGNVARNTSDLGTGTWSAWVPGNSSGITATYSYSSSAVTYNLYASENGSEYSLIYSGGTPIIEGYKHSSLESYIFYDGSRWALWFDGTYQWVNPNGTQNILPFNSWEIYVAQGAAGNIEVTNGSTGKNISFLVKKTNLGKGGVTTSTLIAGSIYNFSTNSAPNSRNFNTIATNENYFDFLLTEMGYVPSVFKAFVTSQSGIVIDFSKHAIVVQAQNNKPIAPLSGFFNMGNRSMRVSLGFAFGLLLPANYFKIYIIDRRGWDNIYLTNVNQSIVYENYNFNLNLGGDIQNYWQLDEPGGERIDVVNKNNLFEGDATIPNTAGRINYAADFDAVDNTRYLSNDEFVINNTFSISCWVKLHSYSAYEQAIWGTNAYDPVSSLYISNGTNKFEFYNNIIDLTLTTNIVPDLETWYHTVYIVNRNQMYLYINGNLAGVSYTVGTDFINNSNTGGGLALSSYFYDGPGIPGYPINAAIDEVGIWNRMLNESEIKALYNFGNGLPVENFYT